jgi:hypothetical protein
VGYVEANGAHGVHRRHPAPGNAPRSRAGEGRSPRPPATLGTAADANGRTPGSQEGENPELVDLTPLWVGQLDNLGQRACGVWRNANTGS